MGTARQGVRLGSGVAGRFPNNTAARFNASALACDCCCNCDYAAGYDNVYSNDFSAPIDAGWINFPIGAWEIKSADWGPKTSWPPSIFFTASTYRNCKFDTRINTVIEFKVDLATGAATGTTRISMEGGSSGNNFEIMKGYSGIEVTDESGTHSYAATVVDGDEFKIIATLVSVIGIHDSRWDVNYYHNGVLIHSSTNVRLDGVGPCACLISCAIYMVKPEHELRASSLDNYSFEVDP